MSDPVRLLTALTHALSTLGLYGADHPATRRAAEAAYRRVHDLQSRQPQLAFTFLPGEVLLGREILPDLERWEWSGRFARAGIERLEVTGPVSEAQFERFLGRLAAILGLTDGGEGDLWQDGAESLRFGRLRVDDPIPSGPAIERAATRAVEVSLHDERDTVAWLQAEVAAGRPIPVLEAYSVVQALSFAMHGGVAMIVPLLQLKEFDQYTTTHSFNVSVLSMALAEFTGLSQASVRTIGLAGLLHDLGKVRIPHEILVKAGKLTHAERAVIQTHPAAGARILLEGDESLDLPAMVAYEHHRCHDGGGYPRPHYARPVHHASRLVHVCDVYDALRTRRPYRDAWSSEQTLTYIHDRAGAEFDPTVAAAFIGMMRKWDGRIALEDVA
ncbi:MAG: HD domain-containing phosphohydrolase [Candidatus Limnocylindria bacterium]